MLKETMQTSLSQSEFARQLRISRQMVSRYVQSGLPMLANGRIDPHAGRAWLRANVERRRAGDKIDNLATARTRKEAALARRYELELRVREGKLIEVARVEQAWTAIAVRIRNAVMGLPAQIVNRISAEHRNEVSTVAMDECRKILTALSDEIRSMKTAGTGAKG